MFYRFSHRGNSSQLLQLFSDLESLLASDSHFLLGRWLEAAKALATTSQERDMYENGARMQITIWGPSKKVSVFTSDTFVCDILNSLRLSDLYMRQ